METTYRFQWHDYLLFTTMLIASSLIGLYYGILKRKQSTLKEYVLGGENMKILPVGLSITASIISSIAMSAFPAEIYNYGVTICLIILTMPIIITVMYYSILPVFYNLKLTSIYEYMELRFDGRIQKITSFLYMLNMLTFLPIIICLSAMSLEQGTGFNTIYISIVICLVCTFYTTIGGIKTVVWTDSLQLLLMFTSAIVVVVLGTNQSGGFWNVLNVSKTGGRFDIDFDFDLTKKDTFWALGVANSFYWLQMIAFNQAYIQKCFTLPSMQHIKKSFGIFLFSVVCLFSMLAFTGLIMYTEFKDCDPKSAGKIKYPDQLVSYYILRKANLFPGIAGIFIAGMTSGAISTLSAGMNALSITIYKDFISPFLPKDTTEYRIGIIIKITATSIGLISTSIVYVVSKLGSTFPTLTSFGGITSGPVFGLYLLGMFTTSANSKGALCGVIGSVSIMSWMVFGSLYYRTNKIIVHPTKPISTAFCYNEYNTTHSTENYSLEQDWKPFYLYRISFFYYSIIGAALVLVIGLVVSKLTRSGDRPVKKELISPWMHWRFRKQFRREEIEDLNNTEKEGVTSVLLL